MSKLNGYEFHGNRLKAEWSGKKPQPIDELRFKRFERSRSRARGPEERNSYDRPRRYDEGRHGEGGYRGSRNGYDEEPRRSWGREDKDFERRGYKEEKDYHRDYHREYHREYHRDYHRDRVEFPRERDPRDYGRGYRELPHERE